MSKVRFPSVDAIRGALRDLKPDPYAVYNATGLRYHWIYNFTCAKQHRSAGVNYASMAALVEFLETQGVVFLTADTYQINRASVAA